MRHALNILTFCAFGLWVAACAFAIKQNVDHAQRLNAPSRMALPTSPR